MICLLSSIIGDTYGHDRVRSEIWGSTPARTGMVLEQEDVT